jgi:tetratricopeptide (TPR) repeat protein
MREGPRALLNWCRAGHLPAGTNLLVLVDQFEELFRYQDYSSSEEAEAFVALLLESRQPLEAASARTAELPIYVTLTMRSEFLGACSLVQNLPEAITAGAFLTPRMTREQYREAIVGPAEVCGIKIDDRLVNRMLNELAAFAPWDEKELGRQGPAVHADGSEAQDQVMRLARRADQLPVLQHALNRMWRRACERHEIGSTADSDGSAPGIELTLEDYDAVGGLENALNAHAEAVLGQVSATLGGDPERTAQRLFRALATGGSASEAVRRPTRLRGLIEIAEDERGVRAFVEAFRADECNLLMPETVVPLTPETTIDIGHESLIRQWKRLSHWVVVEAAAAQQWRRLNDRFNMGEPLRGRALENFIAWRKETRPNAAWSRRYGGGGYGEVIGFLERSERAEKARRFVKIGTIAAAFAAVCAVALTMYGLWQSARSERNQAELSARDARNASIDTAQLATLARNRLSNAVQDYEGRVEDVLDWAPPSWAAYLHKEKAVALSETGKFAAALDDIHLALKADPQYLPNLVTAADLEVSLGMADAAVRDSEAYLQVNKTDAIAYGNLILAQAMRRNYAAALESIGYVLRSARMPIGDIESLNAPDVQTVIHGFTLSVPDSDFLLALRYIEAGIDAMKGDGRFAAVLDAADKSDIDHPYSRNSYLTALSWLWLIVRGESALDLQAAQAKGDAQTIDELTDYGAYAIEGALWKRMALTRPEFRERALRAYQKFQAAYRRKPQERYASLAAWVADRVGEEPRIFPPEPVLHCPDGGDLPLVDCAQAMAQRAQELKDTEGDYATEFAPAYSELSAAINELTPETCRRTEQLDMCLASQMAKGPLAIGRRQKDLLIDLLLRRADWRLSGGSDESDKGGATADARAVIALNKDVPRAYRILAAAASDDGTRRTNDEKALELDPYDADALWDLANLVADEDPKSAIALVKRRARITTLWSKDYRFLAELEMRTGDYGEALRDIENSIARAPWNLDYYAQRRNIEEKAGNVDAAVVSRHFVRGVHDAAAYDARTGDDGQAVKKYVLAFLAASAVKTPNADAQFELETIIRDFSTLLSDNYSLADARLFWQNLSRDPLLDPSQQQLAAQEAARLAPQPPAQK